MRRFVMSLVFAVSTVATAQAGMQEDKDLFFKASYRPLDECGGGAYSPELKSGCVTLPPATTRFQGTKQHPAVLEWPVSNEAKSGKVFGSMPASLRVKDVKPVYKRQARRLVAPKQCANCKFVSAQSAQGKQIARMMQRQMGIQMAGVIGFFVPFPFSLAVNTLTCAAVSTGFDAKEYREDYNEEPTEEQYQKAFGSNAFYCSPIGGVASAIESKNPLRVMAAAVGFSSYFVNIPPAVMHGTSAVQMVGGYATPAAAGQPGGKQVAKAVAQKPVKQVRTAVAKQHPPKANMVAAVQP